MSGPYREPSVGDVLLAAYLGTAPTTREAEELACSGCSSGDLTTLEWESGAGIEHHCRGCGRTWGLRYSEERPARGPKS